MMLLPSILPLLVAPVHAAEGGIVVRLEPGSDPVTVAPVVTLTPTSGGAALSLELKDDGAAPDVSAGDGRWAGLLYTADNDFTVQVEVRGETLDAGAVSWNSASDPRDLVLSLSWSGVTAHASSPGAPVAGAERPQAAASGGAAPSQTSSAPAVAAPTPSVADRVDPLSLLAFGGGALCLLLGFGLAVRNARPPLVPMPVQRLAEPPLFGPGTPALHRGLSFWTVATADRDAFSQALVRTLARHHRVLLLLPDGAALPTAFGGPVYPSREAARKPLEDLLVQLTERPGLPICALYVQDDPPETLIADLADILEPDLGGVLLTSGPTAGRAADVAVTRTDAGWSLAVGEATIDLTEDDAGLHRRG